MALSAEAFVPYWNCTLPPDNRKFLNVLYPSDPCLDVRYKLLGNLTRREADFFRRIVLAVVLGAVVGYERRSPDRPAGIRTMSLTALGACIFTLAGTFAFETGPMEWDASRISAAIPSGCGFLGAGLIWKGFVRQKDSTDVHQVHGLTTAASIWIAASIGTAAGGAMFFVATFSAISIVLMLRFGPRNKDMNTDENEDEQEQETSKEETLQSLADAGAAVRAASQTSTAGETPMQQLNSQLPGSRPASVASATGSSRRRRKSAQGSLMTHN